MSGLLAISRRELRSLFLSPVAWVILSGMQLLSAYLLLAGVERYLLLQPQLVNMSQPPGLTQFLIARFYAPVSVIYLLIIPLLSMRLVSEERRQNTWVLLLTAPLNSIEIVFGKLLGLWVFFLIPLGLNALMLLGMTVITPIDTGAVLLATLGAFLMIVGVCAAGFFFSTLTRQPVIAAFALYCFLLFLWLSGNTTRDDSAIFYWLAPHKHLESFYSGLLHTGDLGYYAWFIAFFLLLSVMQTATMKGYQQVPSAYTGFIKSWCFFRPLRFVFVICLAAVMGYFLFSRDHWQIDLTATQRNTLSEASETLLKTLQEPISVTVYTTGQTAPRQAIESLVARYQRVKSDMVLSFVDLGQSPALAEQLDIQNSGTMAIRYGNREERLQQISEASISQALYRLYRDQRRKLVFMTGHGERDPQGSANFDMSRLSQRLTQNGFEISAQSLVTSPQIAEDVDVVILASPRYDYFPGEMAVVLDFIRRGGNLLWFVEPGRPLHVEALAAELGVKVLPGVVIDQSASLYGVDSPDFALVSQYPAHPLTTDLRLVTLFPQAAGLVIQPHENWQTTPFLQTSQGSWTEVNAAIHPQTKQLMGEIRFDADTEERAGPITLGATLTRRYAEREQRIAVLGDGDFLSNAYLGNGGNLSLAQRLFDWLVGDDGLLKIASQSPADSRVALTSAQIAVLGGLFLVLLPVSLVLAGLIIWWKRRRL